MKRKIFLIGVFMIICGIAGYHAVLAQGQFVQQPVLPKSTAIPGSIVQKLDAAMKAVNCNAAYGEFRGIEKAYIDKKTVCDQMEREQERYFAESSIVTRLIDMKYDAQINPTDTECKLQTKTFVKKYEDQARLYLEMANNNYNAYRSQCGAGASLDFLESSKNQALIVACRKCNFDWPGTEAHYEALCRAYKELEESVGGGTE